MLSKLTLIALALLAATALAQIDITPSSSTDRAFESVGPVEAKLFLPDDVMKGQLHSVRPQADNDGLVNTYYLDSRDEVFAVTTGLALRTRIREIYAIDRLRATSKTEEFGKAMAAAGKQKIENVKGIVKDPVGTIKRVPQGASRFFGRIGDTFKSAGSNNESKNLQGITGVEKAKVKLAAKLGVRTRPIKNCRNSLLTPRVPWPGVGWFLTLPPA
jgi:hypothetical protein